MNNFEIVKWLMTIIAVYYGIKSCFTLKEIIKNKKTIQD